MAFGRQRDWRGYVSGWCPHCGRRRGSDGRCNNCDPWYTNPLVQYGAPFIAIVTVFLLAGAAMLAPHRAEGDTPSGAVLSVPESTYPTYTPLAGPAPRAVTVTAMPAPPNPATVAMNFASYVSPEAQQYQELENLRTMTSYVDARVNQMRAERRTMERQTGQAYRQSALADTPALSATDM